MPRVVSRLLDAWRVRTTPADDANRYTVWKAGERAAANAVKSAGMRVLARNAQTAAGEADLVCLDTDGSLVIVEVKARVVRDERPYRPESAITARKRRTLAAIAKLLSKANHIERVRIDVFAVEFAAGPRPLGRNGPGDPVIRHHRSAIGSRGAVA